ncbi:MAG: hypothetical protein GY705_24635 [Bacteroidetes bacterium]|nr:hypothetical protein [Bacteroidota bacterium]
MFKNILVCFLVVGISACTTPNRSKSHDIRPPFIYNEVEFEHPVDSLLKNIKTFQDFTKQRTYLDLNPEQRHAINHYLKTMNYCESSIWEIKANTNQVSSSCEKFMLIYRDLYMRGYTWGAPLGNLSSIDPTISSLRKVSKSCENKNLNLGVQLYPSAKIRTFCNRDGGVSNVDGGLTAVIPIKLNTKTASASKKAINPGTVSSKKPGSQLKNITPEKQIADSNKDIELKIASNNSNKKIEQDTNENKIPILIANFYRPSIAGSTFAWELNGMSNAIDIDLENSGQFEILHRKKFLYAATYRDEPVIDGDENYQHWRHAGVKYLVVARAFDFFRLDPSGEDIYEVEFQLLDVQNGKQLIGYNLLGTLKEFRSLGHFIADRIHIHFIGVNSKVHLKTAGVKINFINPNKELPESISKLVPEKFKRVANKAVNGEIKSAKIMGLAFIKGEEGGYSIEKNHIGAEYFLKIAAEAGDRQSLRQLAQMYYDGDAIDRNLGLSVNYYRQIALQNKVSRPSYKDLVKALIALGGDNNLIEATQWMDKEMKAKSIERSSSITGALTQFKYLYQGGYQAEKGDANSQSELAKISSKQNLESKRTTTNKVNLRTLLAAATNWHLSDSYNVRNCSLLGISLEGQISGALAAAKIGSIFLMDTSPALEIAREANAEQGECMKKVIRKHHDELQMIISTFQSCGNGIQPFLTYSKWWGGNVIKALALKIKSDDISVEYKVKTFHKLANKNFNQSRRKSSC